MGTPAVRVLHIVTRYRRGGSEQRIRDIVAALDDCEHVVVVGDDSDVELARRELGVTVEYLPTLVRAPRPASDARAVTDLVRRIRRTRPDVVVTHQSKAGAVGRVAACIGRVPAVHSLSMANFGPGFSRGESAVFRVVERVLVPATDRYLVVGDDLARRFQVAGVPAAKLTVVRSGATLPAPRPEVVPPVPGVPDDRPVIVALGALEPRKHPLDLVPLLERVRRTVPDAFLAVAGEGPLRDELEVAVAAAGLTGDVGILGYVKPVEPLLWRADVLVLMSDAEGLPQVLVQAAAAGTPFVTYEVDGAWEMVALGAQGSVVPHGALERAADAVTARLTAGRDPGARPDLSSWQPATIHAAYRSAIGDVVGEMRRAG